MVFSLPCLFYSWSLNVHEHLVAFETFLGPKTSEDDLEKMIMIRMPQFISWMLNFDQLHVVTALNFLRKCNWAKKGLWMNSFFSKLHSNILLLLYYIFRASNGNCISGAKVKIEEKIAKIIAWIKNLNSYSTTTQN